MTHSGEVVDYLHSVETGFRDGTLFQWGLARNEDDLVIGTCTLCRIDIMNRRAELGYALGFPFWGNGFMGEALGVLLSHAFNGLRIHRMEADVDPRNAASIKTLERLGFQREGLLRERWLVGGETQDSLLYGLLRTDWERPEAPGATPQ